MAKILIVDDDEMTLKSIDHLLSARGHQVMLSDSGIKALEIIKKEKFDLIISDVMMPGMDGLILLNLLKQFYLNRTPVIFISSLTDKNIITKSLSMGAEDFITKPISLEELCARVDKYAA